ncbi:MAG TPA: hypothetical protein DCO86_02475 [Spirochaetaceae bacterium]|nr:hypothetical protein [Spirochaetaceae bacterium]
MSYFQDVGERDFVHIRIADISSLGLAKSHSALLRLLPSEDREKVSAYVRENDQMLCLAGRTMIRALAMETTGRSDIRLRFSEFGKPSFAFENAPHFNLSHSGDCVALAYCNSPVGVDIEQCKDFEWEDAAGFFSDAEKALILSDRDNLGCFYKVWTIREAISKAEGQGLPAFDSSAISIDFARKEALLNGKKLFFDDWNVSGYSLSVCSQRRFDAVVSFVTREDWQRMTERFSEAL